MTISVLVAYSSKYGATAEIAQKIGEVLSAASLNINTVDVETTPDAAAYDAVILGSAVYAGQWRKPAADYLTAHEATLAQRPTWFFSSGPTGEGDPVALMKGFRFPEALQPIADRIKPRDIAFFHGVIDLSKLNFAEKLIVKGFKAPTGDFRDWDRITQWATEIAAVLNRQPERL